MNDLFADAKILTDDKNIVHYFSFGAIFTLCSLEIL